MSSSFPVDWRASLRRSICNRILGYQHGICCSDASARESYWQRERKISFSRHCKEVRMLTVQTSYSRQRSSSEWNRHRRIEVLGLCSETTSFVLAVLRVAPMPRESANVIEDRVRSLVA